MRRFFSLIIIATLLISINGYFWQVKNLEGTHEYFTGKNGFWNVRDTLCPDFLLQSELYKGQLACTQGPITYLVPALLKLFFKEKTFSLGILFFSSLLLLLLSIFIFLLSDSILFSLYLLLVVLLPYYLVDFSTLLASFFLILMIYFNYTCPIKRHYYLNFIISGIAAALALFSKTTSLILIGVFISTASFSQLLNYKKDKLNQLIKHSLLFCFSFFIITIIILFLYPNVFTYSFASHVTNTPASLSHVLREFMIDVLESSNSLHLIFILTIILLLGIFVRDKTNLPILILMSSIVPIHILIQSVDTANTVIQFKIFDYHLLPYLIIFISGSFILYKKERTKITLLISLIILFWALYFIPSSDAVYFFKESNKITSTNVFNDFLNTLDYSSAFVDLGVARFIKKPIFQTVNDFSLQPQELWGIPDSNQAAGLKKKGVFNASKNEIIYQFHANQYLNATKQALVEINKNKPSYILTAAWRNSPLHILFFSEIKPEHVCSVSAPFLIDDTQMNIIHFFFFSKENCNTIRNYITNFFEPRLTEICNTLNSDFINFTLQIFKENDINFNHIPATCAQTNKKNTANDTTLHFVFFILFFTLFIASRQERKTIQIHRLRRVGFICANAIMIIILLNLLIKIIT